MEGKSAHVSAFLYFFSENAVISICAWADVIACAASNQVKYGYFFVTMLEMNDLTHDYRGFVRSGDSETTLK